MTTIRRILSFALLIVVAFTASLVLTGRMRDADDAAAQNPAPTATPAQAPGAAATGAPTVLIDFTKIAERTVPAVVNISTQQVVSRRVYDPFAEFFGRRGMQSRRGVANSIGSGVIISNDGYILTNNHVVTGEPGQRGITIEQLDVSITHSDKREMRADVIGVDPATDLALLKVDASGLPTMAWGDSSKLKVAEWVLAIGNPYRLSETVTLGIVSAVGRTNLGVSTFEDFIQTDAAINPGNSGGALVNTRGELVGINTVIFSQSGGYQGIGFAVSSNLARKIFNDLRQYQEVRRGWMGNIRFVPLTTQLAEALRAPDLRGALVYEMDPRAPAYKAGIEPGDVVIGFNGTEVTDPGHLERLMSDTPIGSTATLTIIRDGRRTDVRVPISRRTA
jgi:Do/DeqQ family serine protease